MGGFGHIKPAEALVEQFSKRDIDGEIYDIFSTDGRPNYNSANIYHTLTRSKYLLPIWNLLTRHDLLPSWLFSPVHLVELLQNQATIKKLITMGQNNPDQIITATHWTPALLAAKAFPEKTIFLYVTDIHPHGLWKISPPNIHYLVPMEETKIDVARYGIPESRITISSFPIHQEILDGNHQRHLRRIKNLKQKNPRIIDVLIISGGAGAGKAEIIKLIKNFLAPAKAHKVRLTLLASTPSLQVDLIAFCAQMQTTRDQIFIDRYSPHSLYAALTKAEILITKSGGDVTFEALAEGLPIYTLRDVGDHERLNRQYLELIGASKPLYYTDTPWQLIQSDIFSGEIILMTKASYRHGDFHRRSNTPQNILKITKQAPLSTTPEPPLES